MQRPIYYINTIKAFLYNYQQFIYGAILAIILKILIEKLLAYRTNKNYLNKKIKQITQKRNKIIKDISSTIGWEEEDLIEIINNFNNNSNLNQQMLEQHAILQFANYLTQDLKIQNNYTEFKNSFLNLDLPINQTNLTIFTGEITSDIEQSKAKFLEIFAHQQDVDFMYLDRGHWISGKIQFSGNQKLIEIYDSAGQSPCTNQLRTVLQSIVDKDGSIEIELTINPRKKNILHQKDGYFCGGCALYNLKSDFFDNLGIKNPNNSDEKQYNLFKQQMILSIMLIRMQNSIMENALTTSFGKLNQEKNSIHDIHALNRILDRKNQNPNLLSIEKEYFALKPYHQLEDSLQNKDVQLFNFLHMFLQNCSQNPNKTQINQRIEQILEKCYKKLDFAEINTRFLEIIKIFNEQMADGEFNQKRNFLTDLYQMLESYKKDINNKINSFLQDFYNELTNDKQIKQLEIICQVTDRGNICLEELKQDMDANSNENTQLITKFNQLINTQTQNQNISFLDKLQEFFVQLPKHFNIANSQICLTGNKQITINSQAKN